MASRVTTSNFRLGTTNKLWPRNTKKTELFKVVKLGAFLSAFLYHYLWLTQHFILFTYFYYRTNLFWFIDLFVFRGRFNFRKDVKARPATVWERKRVVFYKFRRPFTIFAASFPLLSFDGFFYTNAGRKRRIIRYLLHFMRRYPKRVNHLLTWFVSYNKIRKKQRFTMLRVNQLYIRTTLLIILRQINRFSGFQKNLRRIILPCLAYILSGSNKLNSKKAKLIHTSFFYNRITKVNALLHKAWLKRHENRLLTYLNRKQLQLSKFLLCYKCSNSDISKRRFFVDRRRLLRDKQSMFCRLLYRMVRFDFRGYLKARYLRKFISYVKKPVSRIQSSSLWLVKKRQRPLIIKKKFRLSRRNRLLLRRRKKTSFQYSTFSNKSGFLSHKKLKGCRVSLLRWLNLNFNSLSVASSSRIFVTLSGIRFCLIRTRVFSKKIMLYKPFIPFVYLKIGNRMVWVRLYFSTRQHKRGEYKQLLSSENTLYREKPTLRLLRKWFVQRLAISDWRYKNKLQNVFFKKNIRKKLAEYRIRFLGGAAKRAVFDKRSGFYSLHVNEVLFWKILRKRAYTIYKSKMQERRRAYAHFGKKPSITGNYYRLRSRIIPIRHILHWARWQNRGRKKSFILPKGTRRKIRMLSRKFFRTYLKRTLARQPRHIDVERSLRKQYGSSASFHFSARIEKDLKRRRAALIKKLPFSFPSKKKLAGTVREIDSFVWGDYSKGDREVLTPSLFNFYKRRSVFTDTMSATVYHLFNKFVLKYKSRLQFNACLKKQRIRRSLLINLYRVKRRRSKRIRRDRHIDLPLLPFKTKQVTKKRGVKNQVSVTERDLRLSKLTKHFKRYSTGGVIGELIKGIIRRRRKYLKTYCKLLKKPSGSWKRFFPAGDRRFLRIGWRSLLTRFAAGKKLRDRRGTLSIEDSPVSARYRIRFAAVKLLNMSNSRIKKIRRLKREKKLKAMPKKFINLRWWKIPLSEHSYLTHSKYVKKRRRRGRWTRILTSSRTGKKIKLNRALRRFGGLYRVCLNIALPKQRYRRYFIRRFITLYQSSVQHFLIGCDVKSALSLAMKYAIQRVTRSRRKRAILLTILKPMLIYLMNNCMATRRRAINAFINLLLMPMEQKFVKKRSKYNNSIVEYKSWPGYKYEYVKNQKGGLDSKPRLPMTGGVKLHVRGHKVKVGQQGIVNLGKKHRIKKSGIKKSGIKKSGIKKKRNIKKSSIKKNSIKKRVGGALKVKQNRKNNRYFLKQHIKRFHKVKDGEIKGYYGAQRKKGFRAVNFNSIGERFILRKKKTLRVIKANFLKRRNENKRKRGSRFTKIAVDKFRQFYWNLRKERILEQYKRLKLAKMRRTIKGTLVRLLNMASNRRMKYYFSKAFNKKVQRSRRLNFISIRKRVRAYIRPIMRVKYLKKRPKALFIEKTYPYCEIRFFYIGGRKKSDYIKVFRRRKKFQSTRGLVYNRNGDINVIRSIKQTCRVLNIPTRLNLLNRTRSYYRIRLYKEFKNFLLRKKIIGRRFIGRINRTKQFSSFLRLFIVLCRFCKSAGFFTGLFWGKLKSSIGRRNRSKKFYSLLSEFKINLRRSSGSFNLYALFIARCLRGLGHSFKKFIVTTNYIRRLTTPKNSLLRKRKILTLTTKMADAKLLSYLSLFVFLQRKLKNRGGMLTGVKGKLLQKVFKLLLCYWFGVRWKYYRQTLRLNWISYMSASQQRNLLKVLSNKTLTAVPIVRRLKQFFWKFIKPEKKFISKRRKLRVRVGIAAYNKLLRLRYRIAKFSQYFLWIRGWARFRRIRRKISNIRPYWRYFNRNYSKGRRRFCLFYLKISRNRRARKERRWVISSNRKANKRVRRHKVARIVYSTRRTLELLKLRLNLSLITSRFYNNITSFSAPIRSKVVMIAAARRYRSKNELISLPAADMLYRYLYNIKRWTTLYAVNRYLTFSKDFRMWYAHRRFNKKLCAVGGLKKRVVKPKEMKVLGTFLDLKKNLRDTIAKKRRVLKSQKISKNRPHYSALTSKILLSSLTLLYTRWKRIFCKIRIRQKKKFFLLKYCNLLYSLKLSAWFRTSVRCFFISCFLFFKMKAYKFYKRMTRNVLTYGTPRKLDKYFLKRFNFIFFLSFKFKQFHLFLSYIKFLFMKYSRRQFIALSFYKAFLKRGFFEFSKNLIGIQFSYKGKMNRRPRARRILFLKKRKPPFQDLQLKVFYYAKEVITYFGAFMFRLWIYYY